MIGVPWWCNVQGGSLKLTEPTRHRLWKAPFTRAGGLEPAGRFNRFSCAAFPSLTAQSQAQSQPIHAKSCEATDDWNGTEPVNGRQSEVPAATGLWTYTLTCTGIGGIISASATVTVTP